MTIQLIKPGIVNGSLEWAGTTHEVDAAAGRELILTGVAQAVNLVPAVVAQDISPVPLAAEATELARKKAGK